MGVVYDVVYQSFNKTIWLVIAENGGIIVLVNSYTKKARAERENATNVRREGEDSYILVYAGTVPIISPKYKISFIS